MYETVYAVEEIEMEKGELNELVLSAQRGDKKAKEQLVFSMMPAAAKLAAEYSRNVYGGESHFEDYRSAAYEGLLISLGSFDAAKGQFCGYATEAMRISIRAYISKSQNIIRPSKHMIEKTAKISKAQKELEAEGRENVTASDLAFRTGLSEKVVKRTMMDMNSLNVFSLDYTYSDGEDGDVTLLDACVSDSYVEESVLDACEYKAFEDSIMNLSEQERSLLCSEYGAFGFDKVSAKTLADRFGVTSTTIRNRRKAVQSTLLAAVGY